MECEDFHLLIYNRWGEKIFESFDIADSWDGTFRHHSVPEGVYCYICEGKFYHRTGTVTVIR